MTDKIPEPQPQPKQNSPLHGVLVVDKPQGPTSHDIVAQARRYFRTRQVGHAGTLDPMASGVLLILLGEATKLSSQLTLEQKSYEATITFGMATDSDDAEGVAIETVTLSPDWLDEARLSAALEAERDRTIQLPPRVTAIKQDGMAAHKRHRLGLEIEVLPRPVRVAELTLLERSSHSVRVSMTVSKGYYVRSLARDLGLSLGVPAHLSALRRTSSGAFGIGESVPWPLANPPTLLPIAETAKRVLPHLVLTAEGLARACVGKVITSEHWVGPLGKSSGSPLPEGTVAWLSLEGQLVALGEFDSQGIGRVKRGFVPESPQLASPVNSDT